MAPLTRKKKTTKTDESIKQDEELEDHHGSDDGSEDERGRPKITQEEEEDEEALLDEQQQQQQQLLKKRDDGKVPAKESRDSKSVSFDVSKVQLKVQRRQEERLEQVRILVENQAAAAAANPTSPDTKAAKSAARLKVAPPMLPLAESLERQAKKNLSPKELAFVNYYKASVDHVITPKIPKEGFSSGDIMRHLNDRPQKYSIMMHYQDTIHLFTQHLWRVTWYLRVSLKRVLTGTVTSNSISRSSKIQ